MRAQDGSNCFGPGFCAWICPRAVLLDSNVKSSVALLLIQCADCRNGKEADLVHSRDVRAAINHVPAYLGPTFFRGLVQRGAALRYDRKPHIPHTVYQSRE